jgi:Flp pilus assembly protein TadG
MLRRARTRLLSDRRATAALEFAIVSVPFIGFVLGMAITGMNLYLQHALDVALLVSVRQIQLGAVPVSQTAAGFISGVFCSNFATFAPCDGVVLTVQPVANFVSAPVAGGAAAQNGGGFCTGTPGQLMYAQAVYFAPIISSFWPWAQQASFGGQSGVALTAGAAWANENPSGQTVSGATGC